MIIRLEEEKDFPEIYEFTKEAFKTAEVKDGDEQNFVERLRKSGNYLPQLAFVAEKDGEIIGHIMLTKTTIENEDQNKEILILAPLTIRFDQRKKGLGKEMIAVAEKKATELGYQAILLIGDPNYYQRFGYRQASELGIVPDQEIPSEYILAKIITEEKSVDLAGTVLIPL